jgi:hypothetical protein
MLNTDQETMAARLMLAGALICGIIGLVAGMADYTWKLGSVGWFTGGGLVAIIALAMLVDARDRRAPG